MVDDHRNATDEHKTQSGGDSTSPSPLWDLARPIHPARAWAVGLAYWLLLIPLTMDFRHSGNVWSRYMTIEAFAERGTLIIDNSPVAKISGGTPDVAQFRGHFYSDKPPVLPAIGAVLYKMFGLSFTRSEDDLKWTNLVLTALSAGLCSALSLVGIRLLLQSAPVPRLAADFLTLAFGFSSILLCYAVTFNNHSVATGLVTIVLAYLALEPPLDRKASPERSGKRRRSSAFRFAPRWRHGILGICAGLTATMDLPVGCLLCALATIGLLVRDRALPVMFLLGIAGPIALHCILQTQVTGSPLPVEMFPNALEFPGSYWATDEGRFKETGPRILWGLEFLFGYQGWLTVTPVLIIGLVSVAYFAVRPGDRLRPLAVTTLLITLILCYYYIWGVRRTDFGGRSYGTRHMLAISPVIYAFAVIAVARIQRLSLWALFATTIVIGAAFAVPGAKDPWSRIEQRPDPILKMLRYVTPYPVSTYPR